MEPRKSFAGGLEVNDVDIERLEDEAYDQGFQDGLDEDVEVPSWIENFLEELSRAGLDSIDSIEVRWDAALKALVCTQKGKEVSFK